MANASSNHHNGNNQPRRKRNKKPVKRYSEEYSNRPNPYTGYSADGNYHPEAMKHARTDPQSARTKAIEEARQASIAAAMAEAAWGPAQYSAPYPSSLFSSLRNSKASSLRPSRCPRRNGRFQTTSHVSRWPPRKNHVLTRVRTPKPRKTNRFKVEHPNAEKVIGKRTTAARNRAQKTKRPKHKPNARLWKKLPRVSPRIPYRNR